MRIVDFRLDHPCLRESLRATPEMTIEWVKSDVVEGRTKIVFWAEGGDFEAFESAVSNDPTVSGPQRSIPVGDRRLYQFDLDGPAAEADMYPKLVDVHGFIQRLTATHRGWDFRIVFPEEGTVGEFFTFVSENDLEYVIHRFSEERDADVTDDFGLTRKQRDVLLAAHEAGYFDVPRKTHLKDVGETFGISDTSASQRIRRGIKTLIENTIGPD